MKDIELKIIIQLLKNSHRSDRELAKAIGTSQPTITRNRQKLEKQGIIKEYTIVPDYSRIGLTLMSITFTKIGGQLSEEILDDYTKRARNNLKENPSALILGNVGMGCDADYVTVALHRDYSEYSEFMRDIRQFPNVKIDQSQSFIIDLSNKNHLQPLSFHYLAEYLAKAKRSQQTARAPS